MKHLKFQFYPQTCFNMFLIAIIILDLCISYSTCSMAGKVFITQNITGLIGNNDTQMTCSFISEADKRISIVQIYGKNKTQEFDDIKKPIAIFKANQPGKLLSSGNYLKGRVTLTNITTMSTNATITFNELKCEDEKDYMCKCSYEDFEGVPIKGEEKSAPTRVSVKVMSSKPDHISSIIVASTTEMQGFTSSIYKTTLSSKKGDSFSIPSSIETGTKTQLLSTDNLPLVYNEEDNVKFTCTGNIGNPPGKFIWKKTIPQGKTPITYSNETTYMEEIPGNCSSKGISHLTIKICREDIRATIRCFEESQVNAPGMYLETRPLDVHFQVNLVDINKQPNQKQYDQKTNNITLNCTANGNPQPTYAWFKKGQNDSILSNKRVYVIQNVIRNNSGVYICKVNNSIDNINYSKSKSVEIHIVDNLESSEESDWWMFVKEHRIPFICGVVGFIVFFGAVIVCCICQKKKKNKTRCSQKTKSVGITMSTEYATVIRKNNATSGETGDSMLVLNGMDGNRDKSRNKQEDLGKTVDVTTSYHINEYAVPSDALHTGTINCPIGPGFTSFKDVKDI